MTTSPTDPRIQGPEEVASDYLVSAAMVFGRFRDCFSGNEQREPRVDVKSPYCLGSNLAVMRLESFHCVDGEDCKQHIELADPSNQCSVRIPLD